MPPQIRRIRQYAERIVNDLHFPINDFHGDLLARCIRYSEMHRPGSLDGFSDAKVGNALAGSLNRIELTEDIGHKLHVTDCF